MSETIIHFSFIVTQAFQSCQYKVWRHGGSKRWQVICFSSKRQGADRNSCLFNLLNTALVGMTKRAVLLAIQLEE